MGESHFMLIDQYTFVFIDQCYTSLIIRSVISNAQMFEHNFVCKQILLLEKKASLVWVWSIQYYYNKYIAILFTFTHICIVWFIFLFSEEKQQMKSVFYINSCDLQSSIKW